MVSGAKGGGDAIWNYFFPSFKMSPYLSKSLALCLLRTREGPEIQDKQIQDIWNIIGRRRSNSLAALTYDYPVRILNDPGLT
jgi:hypothetical protein